MKRRQFLSMIGGALAAAAVTGSGTAAQAQTLKIRRNLLKLPAGDPFFAQYGEAITKMHKLPAEDPRSWRGQALIHPNFCPHNSAQRPDFTLWHRHYLTYFERLCGRLSGNPDFALPYWDWTANRGRLPKQFDTGPLSVAKWKDPSNYLSEKWGPQRIATVGTRAVSSTRGLGDNPRLRGAFTPAAINNILSQKRFDLFQKMLEGGPHNAAHVITGGRNGHMINGLSSLDPIFWLHHCNVDRILARWQRAGNMVNPPPRFKYFLNFVDETGTSVTVTAADAMNFEAMGYTYDEFGEGAGTPSALATPDEAQQTIMADRSITEDIAVLGRAENQEQSRINAVTAIRVSAANLLDRLAQTRTFRPADLPARSRLGIEGARILARLNVSPPPGGDRNVLVNVFVNCPYLSSGTDASDPHYCGSFSFFGGHADHGGTEFIADLTTALREQLKNGQIATENINLQVLPIPVARGEEPASAFTVNAVELISA